MPAFDIFKLKMSVRECVQCKARTANGTRCRRTTCTTKDFCAQHTLMNHHLFLQKSQIPNSGKGLYTSRDIPANTDLAEYTGNIVARGVYVHADSGYGVNIPSSGLILDANSTQHGLGRSQHTAATISRFQAHRRCNTTFPAHRRHNTTFPAYGRVHAR